MPLRISLLVSSMGSGGAERIAASLANAWASRGDSVRLVATFSGRGDCFYKLHPGVELIFLADHVRRSDRSPRGLLSRIAGLRQLVRDHRADVVVSFLTNVNVAAILACLGLRIPVIVSERSYPPLDVYQNARLQLARRLTYPLASRVVMVTRKGCDWLERSVPGSRGCVIPNPVSNRLARNEPVLDPDSYVGRDRRVILAVGRLDPGKQIDILIEAFAPLTAAHPEWDLVVLGHGPSRQSLEAMVLRLGLQTRVRLLGQAGNVGDWYGRADLYVLSSRYEGFPNTLVEAMAHGCPAISYDCDTGPRDIIREDIDGVLVRPVSDAKALEHALRRLMTNDTERERLGTKALEVQDRFSPERVLKMWDSVFDELRVAS